MKWNKKTTQLYIITILYSSLTLLAGCSFYVQKNDVQDVVLRQEELQVPESMMVEEIAVSDEDNKIPKEEVILTDLGYKYSTDGEYVYYDRKKIDDFLYKDFEMLGCIDKESEDVIVVNKNKNFGSKYKLQDYNNYDGRVFYKNSYTDSDVLNECLEVIKYTGFAHDGKYLYSLFENGNFWIKNSDYTSLKKLDYLIEGVSFYYFYSDINNVYYNGQIIPSADPKTFKKISEVFYADKNRVYMNYHYECAPIDIPDCRPTAISEDPDTFEIFFDKIAMAKDKTGLYLGNLFITDVDMESLEPLFNKEQYPQKFYYFKDIYNIYVAYFDDIRYHFVTADIPDSLDLETLELVSDSVPYKYQYYFKDKNNVYIVDDEIENVESGYTFKFYKKNIPSGLDLKTFQIYEDDIMGDKNHIYYKNKSGTYELDNVVDASSLEQIHSVTNNGKTIIYFKDKYNFYYLSTEPNTYRFEIFKDIKLSDFDDFTVEKFKQYIEEN